MAEADGGVAERILILAPRGRDAEVIAQVLEREGMQPAIVDGLAELHDSLGEDASAILLTEESLGGPDLAPLLDWCDGQPSWSDMPVIVLATRQGGRRGRHASERLARLGNVVLLERPVNAETLASAARSALRGRRRQYESRALLWARAESEATLRELNETLERRVEERTRELDAAHENLALALNSAGMGSWDLDLLTNASRRSPQHDRIFGYQDPLPYWSRQDFLDHVVAEDRARAASALNEAEASGVFDLECRIRRRDGARRWIVKRGRARHDRDGRAIRLAGVVMDTTERRMTEDALHQAQKMEAIGQLTGGVAHDFNNLLTVIVSGLDMMQRHPENAARVSRLAGLAMVAARRGEQLTQQLLAFSRRQFLRPQTIDPNRLLREFEGLARRAAGEAVGFALDLEDGIGAVTVDPAQFESALLNLVVNARDAMPEGGSVTVSSRNRHFDAPPRTSDGASDLPEGDYVEIAVADTGTGFDAQTLARAFEPFYTTKDVGKGSGLGLSQVYGFVRSAGGDVTIDTVAGQGASVRLLLPRSILPATAEAAVEMTPRIDQAGSGETILLVEDDEQVLTMAVESLEELHYAVIVARNAHEALVHLERPGRIDVIFSDVVMPGGMNGVTLVAEAKRRRPGLKVLLTSGYPGERGSAKPIAEPLDVLSKPYRREDLARKLRAVLGSS